MPSSHYSFLDVAVLDDVRDRFAAGDALAILSTDLEQVIWANGPGAALFGYPDIDAIIGSSSRLPAIARRQIAATSGYPAIGRDRSVLVRLASGMTSQAIGFLASAIPMPDGEPAILLKVPAAQAASRSTQETARRAIGGFTGEGQFLAMIDEAGGVEAASDGFPALGIAESTLAALVAEAGGEEERIVKRLLPAGGTSLPSGMARLTDNPARYLLVVIDEEEDDDVAGDEHRADTADGADAFPGETASDRGRDEPENAPTPTAEEAEADVKAQEPPEADEPSPQPIETHAIEAVAPLDEAAQIAAMPAPAAGAPPSGGSLPAIDRNASPVRFVWRTDADGRFSSLSPEFGTAMGAAAADIVGRSFKDVAAALGFDEHGEIAGLLERRDTWSGRSVLWPAGTLKVPVDLAALPVYNRSRSFEGFRGFGVARLADAVIATAPAAAPTRADGDMQIQDATELPKAAPETAPEPADDSPETAPGQGSAMAHNQNDELQADRQGAHPGADGSQDPFKGETPALTIVPKPERRFSDKVIRLAEHRPPASDRSLSLIERSAFREIGERLRKDVPAAGDSQASPGSTDAAVAPQASAGSPTSDQPTAAHKGEAAPADAITGLEPPEAEASGENRPDIAAEDEARLEAISESEDTGDLSRLDGVGEAPDTASVAPARHAGSLLDLAGSDETSGDKASAPSDAEPADADEHARMAAAPSMAAAATVEDDDNLARADFEDARDDESLPDSEAMSPDAAGNDAAGENATVEGPVEAPAHRLAPQAPPLRTQGFVPSAFAAAVGQEPDTSLLARLPVPVLIHSGDHLHYANEEFLSLTGHASLAELDRAGGLDTLFVDPYADDSASDGTDRALKLLSSDGDHIPVDAILRSVPWRDGKALMLVIRRAGDDDRATAGAAGDGVQPDMADLKARIAEMRTIIDTATDGVVLIGRDGMIRSISRPAEALFGFDGDEVASKPFTSLFAIESQKTARDYLAGLSEPGVASVLNDGREVIGRESQGRFIPLFMTIGRLPNDSGFCAVVRDITQWKRAEEDLTQARAVAERASSQKTDFLARISHEIRTPLNAIIGFSELMVDEKFGPVANERYRDYLRDINRSGNHVLDLVNDLLDISKIEAGQQEMDYQAVSLNDTLAETVAMMQPQANRERVIIRSSFASRLPDVVADLRSMRQIALNVLSNAIRYTQAGGQVIVSTAYEASGDVVMRVRDTGVGMTAAEIEQALKPFKQLNALKRGRGDGTGLGLPLTKAMVEANRARFTLTSTPGEGTLVEVAFPSTRVLAE